MVNVVDVCFQARAAPSVETVAIRSLSTRSTRRRPRPQPQRSRKRVAESREVPAAPHSAPKVSRVSRDKGPSDFSSAEGPIRHAPFFARPIAKQQTPTYSSQDARRCKKVVPVTPAAKPCPSSQLPSLPLPDLPRNPKCDSSSTGPFCQFRFGFGDALH